jgi:hypothetical protein
MGSSPPPLAFSVFLIATAYRVPGSSIFDGRM